MEDSVWTWNQLLKHWPVDVGGVNDLDQCGETQERDTIKKIHAILCVFGAHVLCLQAGGYELEERVWTTSAPSITEGPAFSTTDVQKHHRGRPEETDYHGQPGRDTTKRPGEEHANTSVNSVTLINMHKQLWRLSFLSLQSPRRTLQRTFSDESLCSGRREASYANSENQTTPTDVLFTCTLPTRRHAVSSNHMQSKKGEFQLFSGKSSNFCSHVSCRHLFTYCSCCALLSLSASVCLRAVSHRS